jgi:hypothetical protein
VVVLVVLVIAAHLALFLKQDQPAVLVVVLVLHCLLHLAELVHLGKEMLAVADVEYCLVAVEVVAHVLLVALDLLQLLLLTATVVMAKFGLILVLLYITLVVVVVV